MTDERKLLKLLNYKKGKFPKGILAKWHDQLTFHSTSGYMNDYLLSKENDDLIEIEKCVRE